MEFHDAHVLDAIEKDGLLKICLEAFVRDNKDIRGFVGVWQRIDLKLKWLV